MEVLSQVQTLPSQIANCSFCLKKDLYAVLFPSGQVTCHRLDGSVVCTPLRSKAGAQHGPVSSLSWRPDGRFLAIGFESGNVRLFETETGQCVATLNERFRASIGNLLWTCDLTQKTVVRCSQETLKGKTYVYESLPRLDPLKKTNGSAINGSGLNTEDALSVLFSASGGHFEICVNGVFSLGLFGDSERNVEGLAFSPDLKRLFVMSSNCHPSTSVHLNVWTADILSKRKTDLSRISALAMQINGLNSYVRESVAALKTECKNITQSLKKQVDLLNAIIEEHGLECSLTNELVYFMAFGSTKSIMVDYLLHSIDEKVLETWDKAVATACSNMKKALITQIFPATQQLLIAVKEIVGYIKSYEIMNGTKTPLSSPGEGLKSIVKLFYRLTDFDMALNKQSKGYSDFIQWLGNGRRKLLDPSGSHPEHPITAELIEFSKTVFEIDPMTQFCLDKEDEDMGTIADQLLPDEFIMFPIVKEPIVESLGTLTDDIASDNQTVLNNFGDALGMSIKKAATISLPPMDFAPNSMSYIIDDSSCEYFLLQNNSSRIEKVVLLRHEIGVWSFVEVNLVETLDFSGSIRSVDFRDAENLVLLVNDNETNSSCVLALHFASWPVAPLGTQGSTRLEVTKANPIHIFDAGWMPMRMLLNQRSVAFQAQQSLGVFCFAEED